MKPDPKTPEAVLVEKCIQGDRKAQYEVYGSYSKAMYNICLRMLNNVAEAEDALQEAFVSVFSNMGSFKGDSSLGSWIKRIVVNQCINRLQKRKLAFETLEGKNADKMEEDNHPDIDLVMEVGAIRDAIMSLPDGYRVVFSLYLLEGYDHEEIAQILNITVSTSKSQYNRAKSKLREVLAAKLKK